MENIDFTTGVPRRNVTWDGRNFSFELPQECVTPACMAMTIPANRMGLTGRTIDIALNFWALGIALRPLLEFREKDTEKIFGTSHTTISKVADLLETAGLAVIDKSSWAMKRGGTYEWRFNDFACGNGKNNGKTAENPDSLVWEKFSYILEGTAFKDALDIYYAAPHDIEELESRQVFDYNEQHGEQSIMQYPEWLYMAPYNKLKYRFVTSGHARLAEAFHYARNYASFKNPPVYKSGRIFYVFHWWKKEYRHGFTYNGSPLTELFDLHCSFFTLTAALRKNDLPRKEYEKLIRDCISGELYMKAARFTGMTRDLAKESLQAWRNSSRNQARANYRAISEFMEREYPIFSRIMYEWPTIIKEGPKRNISVKTLQIDISEFESRVFSKICRILVDKYNVTPFSLHDAVYISEDDMKKLPENISDILLKWFADNVL